MLSFLPQYYDLLKKEVLTKSGIQNITPADCKLIAADIFNKTKHSISETTLKRMYGFAYSKFKPSLFTIDVMARYCNYQGWEDFCLKKDSLISGTAQKQTNWDALKINARKITNFTLQVLRNKSGIPYAQTIKRNFIDLHLNDFLNSDCIATLISAPAGYGKTVALCHWVEERQALNSQAITNDIILFFSTNALMNAFLSGQDLNHWLLALLGYTSNEDITTLFDRQHKTGGNFFLIIDDFDEHVYKPEQFRLLLNQLTDVLSLYQSVSWFKVILTMRAATWINNRHEFDNDNIKWHKAFITDDNWAINVPLFNTQEIRELVLSINPALHYNVSSDIAINFSHPLYFQFYYKQRKDNFTLNDINHACIYELVSTFILNKIYMGTHSAEKLLLLTGVVENMDIVKGQYEVSKIKVNGLIKQYHHAYNELLSIGFIREINNSTGLNYNTSIQFTTNNFLEYTIAKFLLDKNNRTFDKVLINNINTLFINNNRKLPVLKWCIIYAIKAGQQKSFDLISSTQLTPSEKSDLIIFMGDLLDQECNATNKSESLIQYFKQDCSRELFNYFFGLEFINVHYKKTLYTLLKFNLATRKQILIHTALSMVDILSLNLLQLEAHLVKLRGFTPENYNQFAINPLYCIETIYSYLKNGEIKKEAVRNITRFIFNPPLEGNFFDNNASNDMLYLLAGHTLLICQNSIKILRFIDVLTKNYKTLEPTATHGYYFFMKIIAADSYFKLGKTKELVNIYNELNALYKNSANTFTDFMLTVFYALRIKVALHLKKYAPIIEDVKTFMQIADQYTFSKVITLRTILNITQVANIYPQLYKQCQYDHAKLMREMGLAKDTFITAQLVIK
ncbi:hypothetical protein ACFQZX_07655 [Mucilaginibacter litoreus]|uniref:NACHT domain-containing protein n=1 Tax=Mucilaginibacter litoreus TaxID=1048221 RepID=A0ABW3AT95_9SPHI